MSKLYTSGELAKRCDVSVRTVQYYDREGILQAIKRNENGNRLYGEEQEELLLSIRACKELGMHLQEIRQLLENDETHRPLYHLLRQQKQKNMQVIEELKVQNDRIAVLLKVDQLNFHHMSEINALLEKTHRKKKRLVNLLLVFLMLYLFPCLPLMVAYLPRSTFTPIFVCSLLLVSLFGLILYHASTTAYCCTTCGKRFKISVWRDAFTLNGGKKGKYLKCPYCGFRGWLKETHS